MKAKTKKTIVIVAAVAAVALVVWLLLRKKGTDKIISKLNVSDAIKSSIKGWVETISGYSGTEGSWQKSEIEKNAKAKGISYEQQLVLEAAYQLRLNDTIDEATWQAIVGQIQSM